jgi:hypothetical protein
MRNVSGFAVAALLFSSVARADADVVAIDKCHAIFTGGPKYYYFNTEAPGSLCPEKSGCNILAWQGKLKLIRKDGSEEVNESDETKSAYLGSIVPMWLGAVMDIRSIDMGIRDIYKRAKDTGARISELKADFQGKLMSLDELQKRRQKEIDILNGRWAKIQQCKTDIEGRIKGWRSGGMSKLVASAGTTMKRLLAYQEMISLVIHSDSGSVDDQWVKNHSLSSAE